VQTCGCFGDAIPLTPWQSFSKDMALLLLVLVIFVNRKNIKPLFTPKTGDRLLIASVVVAFLIGFYTYSYLPFIDFLPYKVGANILDEMKTPPNAPPDVYETIYNLKNKKTGEAKTINDKDYIKSGIWKDNNWTVVGNPESRLVSKGYTPPIRDLGIQDAQGNDYTKELLSNPYYNLIIVAYNIFDTNTNGLNEMNALAINLKQNFNTRTVLLTGNSPKDAVAFAKAHHLDFDIFYADAVPLKTMIRSNPGLFLMKNGVVVGKWHYHSVPEYDKLAKQYFQKQ